ncbi:MAG: branched-chain amino acid aminotransferase, partial [Erysipelotrichaceae bacterium]
VRLFRVEDNFNRFNASADAIAMPEIPRELFVDGIETLVALEKDWLIYDESVSLYIRPFMIGVDQTLGLKPADDYMFIVILSLAGDYYQSDDFVKIKVEHEHVRAAAKGIGRAKTGGNYAASLKAYAKAKQEGFDQVLWLDGTYGKYVEEVGAMNIFFVIDGVITTPILNDSILPGIVRDSILHFAKALGYKTSERKLSMDEIVHLYQEGHISEVFGSGTAAVVSPVGMLSYQDHEMSFTSNSIAQTLKRYLLDLEYGHRTTDVPWITVL